MFKLSFALLSAVVCGLPTAHQHHGHLVSEKSVNQKAMSESPCPSANEGVCSGNGQCFHGGDSSKSVCTTMEDLEGDTNVCACACDKGWTGWDCFTVDSCTDDMDVTMDYDGIYNDFFKINMKNQVQYKLSPADSCEMPVAGMDKWTFSENQDGYKIMPFKVVGRRASTGEELAWSKTPGGSCGVLKRKLESVQEGDIEVYFYNRKGLQAFQGTIEAHRMKVDGDNCKVFSWQIQKNKKYNKNKKMWGVGKKGDWEIKKQAVWETTGEAQAF